MDDINDEPYLPLALCLAKWSGRGAIRSYLLAYPMIVQQATPKRQSDNLEYNLTQASRPLLTPNLVYSPWYQQWRTKSQTTG